MHLARYQPLYTLQSSGEQKAHRTIGYSVEKRTMVSNNSVAYCPRRNNSYTTQMWRHCRKSTPSSSLSSSMYLGFHHTPSHLPDHQAGQLACVPSVNVSAARSGKFNKDGERADKPLIPPRYMPLGVRAGRMCLRREEGRRTVGACTAWSMRVQRLVLQSCS